jgi:ubiquinone/menaquinone biosynthesis C-methylase UbiE
MPEKAAAVQQPVDKSLFYYGRLYNRLMDPLIAPARQAIVERVPSEASVLDVGCGTGLLCFELRRAKNCRVVGVDLSRRMLEFAQSINPFSDVSFLHQDATKMQDLPDDGFDVVVILNVIHELHSDEQRRMLLEAWRVGNSILLFDANVPLPWHPVGIIKRLIELTFGIDHFPQFRSYLRSGGIIGILKSNGYAHSVVERLVMSQGCNQLVLLSG